MTPSSEGRRRNGGGRGEQAMVPRAEFTSYYGMPVLNAPVWKSDIPAYFFLGGLAGASSVLAAGAQLTGREQLSGRTKGVATAAIALGAVALVHDLGRPSRFANMLRVFKPSSPMSVGSWVLAAYGPAAGVASVANLSRRFGRVEAAMTTGAAVLGPVMSTYTAALITDTAVPAWHDGFREMPFVFAGSSAVAAGGVGLIAAPVSEAAPARRLALGGAAMEFAAMRRLQQRLGMVAEPYRAGTAGRYLRAARALTAAGAGIAIAGRRSRGAGMLAGVLLAGASACTRFGVFEAGKQSAADPKYTVAPQRARARAASAS
ncbi:MAG TPA: NrfD/PsrC family molybdoenzyme membrane anchor subunit [Acidimicrobiales bacterium]|jgi:formate-dependent nitrite reductase membrane component NrfD|nr:NrfD/PsrC family molybdoenzyme membrane anchor subunit [Acidimicrobiales bacterium]